jgi:hypothetical protein
MIMKMLILALVGWLATTAPIAAQGIDTDRAQSQLRLQVDKTISQFVQRIGADKDLQGYCEMEMHLHTYQHPANGQIPFGVNYRDIRSQQHLNLVIGARLVYETNFLKLCIARAKHDLDRALNQ